MSPLAFSSLPTPLGTVYLAATARGICRLAYDTTDEEFVDDLRTRFHCDATDEIDVRHLGEAELQLERYFLGELREFDVPLDFLTGTKFMRRSWQAQTTIPYGQVKSYKWVAEAAGKPRAARAVGQANSKCCISILVPCHRVISSDGSLGGYGARTDVKEYLLRLEGARWGKGAELEVEPWDPF